MTVRGANRSVQPINQVLRHGHGVVGLSPVVRWPLGRVDIEAGDGIHRRRNLYHALQDFVGCTDLDLGKLAQTLAGDISLGGTSRLSPNIIHGLPLA